MNIDRNKALQIGIGIVLAFLLLYNFLPYDRVPHDRFKLYLDAARIGIWGTVWGVTLMVAINAFWSETRNQGEVVAIALNIAAFMIFWQGTWIPLNREWGDYIPDWIKEPMGPLIVTGFIVSGAFFLLPIGNKIGATPPRNWWFLLISGIIGGTFAGVMIGLNLKTGLE